MSKKIISIIFLLLPLAACSQSPTLEDAVSNRFQVGDEWTYNTRPGEPLSTFTVIKIDKTTIDGEEQTIIHIAVNELAIDHPDGGIVTAVPHMPFTEAALNLSAGSPFNIIDPIPQDSLDAYQTWRDRYQSREADIFQTTIAHALDTLQFTIQFEQ